jgi:tetratricopeptide (TPR) repeat protein
MILHTFVGVCALAAVSAPGADQAPAPARQSPPARVERAAQPQSPPTGMSREAEAYFQFMRGRYLESEGDVEGAIKAYGDAARLDPKSAEVLAELASLYARENKFDEALKQGQAALGNDPKNVTAHRVLGVLYGSLARLDEGSGPPTGEAAGYAAKAIEHLDAARQYAEITDAPLDMMLAQAYMRTGNLDKAIDVLRHVANDEPGRPEPVNLLLQAYEQAGRGDDILKLLELVAPEQPQFYNNLADQYARRQRWSDAATAYERAAARNPKSIDLRIRQAAALLSAGGEVSSARAIGVLQQLRKDNPAEGRVLYLLAEAQRRAGRLDDSEQTARDLMKVDPSGLTGPYALALVLEARQQFRQVVETLEPLLGKAPSAAAGFDASGLYIHLGFAEAELGEFDKAVTAFEAARKASPGNPAVDLYLLQAQVSARRYAEAIDLAHKLRASRPGDQRVIRLEAEALRASGRTDEGQALLTAALDANPGDAGAHLALAEYQSQAGKFDAAMDVIDRAATRFPGDLSVAFEAGAILERQKRFADAERKFREVLAKDPLHAQALNYLGYMLADRGERLDEAVGYIKRALESDPNNGAYLDSLGWAYFRQNKFDLAEPLLRRAAEQRVRGSAVQDHFGDLLFKLGRYQEALAAWQRALAGDGDQIEKAAIDRKIRAAREKAPKR